MNVSPSIVRRLVEAQFPQWADLPIEPVASCGWDNRTFHLGENMIVRMPSARAYAAQVEKEHRWLPILSQYLSVPIPAPLALGQPGEAYPWNWSIYAWLPGDTANTDNIGDPRKFAASLAGFLGALQRVDATGGPPPGPHNCFRGGPLTYYDAQVRHAVAVLGSGIKTEQVTRAWEASLAAPWNGPPVWLHGDFSPGNLLAQAGELSAVIDFGCCGVGDPSCDLAIAWTFFRGEARTAFSAGLALDQGAWARGRGWALWKALTVLAQLPGSNPADLENSRLTLEEVLADRSDGSG